MNLTRFFRVISEKNLVCSVKLLVQLHSIAIEVEHIRISNVEPVDVESQSVAIEDHNIQGLGGAVA